MAKLEAKKSKQDVQKAEGHVLTPFEEMDRMFDEFFGRGWLQPFRFNLPSYRKLAAPFEGKTPTVDMIDRENEIVINAELPGVDKKDIDISITSNTVTIIGKTEKEEKEEKDNYYHREISRGSYARTLSLPVNVDEDKARATIKDGLLELVLPKSEKAKKRTIKVE